MFSTSSLVSTLPVVHASTQPTGPGVLVGRISLRAAFVALAIVRECSSRLAGVHIGAAWANAIAATMVYSGSLRMLNASVGTWEGCIKQSLWTSVLGLLARLLFKYRLLVAALLTNRDVSASVHSRRPFCTGIYRYRICEQTVHMHAVESAASHLTCDSATLSETTEVQS